MARLCKLRVRLWLIIILTIHHLTCFTAFGDADQAKSFFEQKRYKGWLWFEEQPNQSVVPSASNNRRSRQVININNITPAEAKAEIERFASELEGLKFMMLARPTPENVRAYREKEKQMWQQAEILHEAWDMANLLYPEQRDLVNNPVNVHAVKAKRAKLEEENSQKINKLAKEFDLILFFNEDCQYCQLLSPILKNFSDQYGFNVEAIGKNGSKHQYFTSSVAPKLIERLGITAFPTIIAVSNDSKIAFELIRGYVSISELEEYSLLAIKYLENLKATDKGQPINQLISNN